MLKTQIGERKTTDLQGIYPVYRLTYLIVDHHQRKKHTPITIQIPSDKRKVSLREVITSERTTTSQRAFRPIIRLEQLPRKEKYYQNDDFKFNLSATNQNTRLQLPYQPTKSERIRLISFPDCVIQPIYDDR